MWMGGFSVNPNALDTHGTIDIELMYYMIRDMNQHILFLHSDNPPADSFLIRSYSYRNHGLLTKPAREAKMLRL